jgi:hypothetical protein
MGRPEWFICRKCLFFKYAGYERIGDWKKMLSEDTGNCFFNNLHQLKNHKSFCSNWTCKNCWEEWNNWHWSEEEDKEIRVNHNQCEGVEFK